MSTHFYTKKENITKQVPIDYYLEIFKDYNIGPNFITDALKELFLSAGLNDEKAYLFTKDIISKSEKILEFNFDLIKEKYPALSREEALIISTYKCEAIDSEYSPYKIMNLKLCENEGIIDISHYFFLFLRTLRQLCRYYPKQKYMYRCIGKKVNLEKDYFNKEIIPFQKGVQKTFYGFISVTSEENLTYELNNKAKEIETIFALYGDLWGYDISLFNRQIKEEIILEPERKFVVNNVIPPGRNKITHIRCEIKESPVVLESIIKSDNFRIKYKFNKNYEYIRIFGSDFCKNNKDNCKLIYKNEVIFLNEFLYVQDVKKNEIEIILTGITNTSNLSHMFDGCKNIYSIEDVTYWNISHISNISYMFNNCESLTNLPDLSKWNTSNVLNMSYMFNNCESLPKIPDISMWDTSKVIDLSYMFYKCNSLRYLSDISRWNVSNVYNIRGILNNCNSLIILPNILRWKIRKINIIPLDELEDVEITKEMCNKFTSKECMICLGEVKVGDNICYLPCFHFFHSLCIKNWIKKKRNAHFVIMILNLINVNHHLF